VCGGVGSGNPKKPDVRYPARTDRQPLSRPAKGFPRKRCQVIAGGSIAAGDAVTVNPSA
jgi:hypothetical protein